MQTIAVIPARAGSRGIPWKNLRRVGGRPLVVRSVEVARAVRGIDRVIVSTDGRRIASAARSAGAEVPFIRPAVLADDGAATVDVVRHAVAWVEAEGAPVDVVVTLQPTSPFCRPETVRAALDRMRDPTVESVATVAEVGLPISVVGTLVGDRLEMAWPPTGDTRRQASSPLVRLTGAVYVSRRALLDAGGLLGERTAPLLTTGAETIDIDDADDLAMARRTHRLLMRTA